jgi:hypothetical protein
VFIIKFLGQVVVLSITSLVSGLCLSSYIKKKNTLFQEPDLIPFSFERLGKSCD